MIYQFIFLFVTFYIIVNKLKNRVYNGYIFIFIYIKKQKKQIQIILR